MNTDFDFFDRSNYITRKIPKYYPTMYLDGYKPWEVMWAVKKDMKTRLFEEMQPDPSIEFLQGLMTNMKKDMKGGKKK